MSSRGLIHPKFLCFMALTDKVDGVWTQFCLLIKLDNFLWKIFCKIT